MIYVGIALVIVGAVSWILRARAANAAQRQELLNTTLTDSQRQMLWRAVPLLQKLPYDLRPALEGKVHLFLDQVTFHGANDLEVTDEIRLSIAAQACLLIVNTDQWYDTLRTIIVYPGAFKSVQRTQSDFIMTEREVVRLGESWPRGPVILSWAHSEKGAQTPDDGHNVVLHEFAHQLDNLSGHTDGAPVMNKGQSFADWSRVILKAFEDHQKAVERGRRTVLDPYGAQSHHEFLAVAIEVFFEKPKQLKVEEPAVYDQLSQLMKLDPANWDQG